MRRLADRIMAGLAEAAEHAGGADVPNVLVHVPPILDVAAIRAKTRLSQPAFADSVGVSVGTLRQWEQRRRSPDGPARVLLAMVDHRPTIVLEMLGTRGPAMLPAAVQAAPKRPAKAGADRRPRSSAGTARGRSSEDKARAS